MALPRDSAEVSESLTLIQNEVMRCKGIIDGLLDFSRPKSTTKLLVDVNSVIEKTLKLVKHHPRFRRVTVGVEPGKGLKPVWANEEQLIQIFMALLLNALDAMDGRPRGLLHAVLQVLDLLGVPDRADVLDERLLAERDRHRHVNGDGDDREPDQEPNHEKMLPAPGPEAT